MMIEARDDDVIGSKLIGKTIVKVSTFVCDKPTWEDWTAVYSTKGKEVGKIKWRATWTRNQKNDTQINQISGTQKPLDSLLPKIVNNPQVKEEKKADPPRKPLVDVIKLKMKADLDKKMAEALAMGITEETTTTTEDE